MFIITRLKKVWSIVRRIIYSSARDYAGEKGLIDGLIVVT